MGMCNTPTKIFTVQVGTIRVLILVGVDPPTNISGRASSQENLDTKNPHLSVRVYHSVQSSGTIRNFGWRVIQVCQPIFRSCAGATENAMARKIPTFR